MGSVRDWGQDMGSVRDWGRDTGSVGECRNEGKVQIIDVPHSSDKPRTSTLPSFSQEFSIEC